MKKRCTIKEKIVDSILKNTNYGVGEPEFEEDFEDALNSLKEATYLKLWSLEDTVALYVLANYGDNLSRDEIENLILTDTEEYKNYISEASNADKQQSLIEIRQKYRLLKSLYEDCEKYIAYEKILEGGK